MKMVVDNQQLIVAAIGGATGIGSTIVSFCSAAQPVAAFLAAMLGIVVSTIALVSFFRKNK